MADVAAANITKRELGPVAGGYLTLYTVVGDSAGTTMSIFPLNSVKAIFLGNAADSATPGVTISYVDATGVVTFSGAFATTLTLLVFRT